MLFTKLELPCLDYAFFLLLFIALQFNFSANIRCCEFDQRIRYCFSIRWTSFRCFNLKFKRCAVRLSAKNIWKILQNIIWIISITSSDQESIKSQLLSHMFRSKPYCSLLLFVCWKCESYHSPFQPIIWALHNIVCANVEKNPFNPIRIRNGAKQKQNLTVVCVEWRHRVWHNGKR